jgi:hypothetical protein
VIVRIRYLSIGRWRSALACLVMFTLGLPAAHAQVRVYPGPGSYCPTPLATPTPVPEGTTPTPTERDITQPPQIAPTAPEPTQVVSSAGLGESTPGGQIGQGAYIDNAIPVTMWRERFDAAYEMNRPDRNEFFYAKCGCFKLSGVDPRAAGPTTATGQANTRVDFQELYNYFELALDKRLSVFVNIPIRWINPNFTANASGLSDIDFGAKYAFIYTCDTVASFQLRTYAPSGEPSQGLGNNHWTVEPSLLLWQRLSDRWFLQGQLTDWIPLDGTDFAGNIIEYGGSLSWIAFDTGKFQVIPVAETLGWTMLAGKEFAAGPNGITGGIVNTSGQTIVNGKFGIRVAFSQALQPGLLKGADIYAGYSRALTGDFWYKDMWRVEYRIRF